MFSKHRKIKSNVVFDGGRLQVFEDELISENGDHANYRYIKKNHGVVIVAKKNDGNLILIRQYRYLIGSFCIELPAGGIDAGESPLSAAQRELHEETGYKALIWSKINEFYPSNGICDEKVHVFLAENLVFIGKPDIEEEKIELLDISKESIKNLITSQEIKGASSIIGLLSYLLVIENERN